MCFSPGEIADRPLQENLVIGPSDAPEYLHAVGSWYDVPQNGHRRQIPAPVESIRATTAKRARDSLHNTVIQEYPKEMPLVREI